jgi:hypothetical protein
VKSRRRWEHSIKIDRPLREVGRENAGWIHLDQNRNHWQNFVNMIIDLLVL